MHAHATGWGRWLFAWILSLLLGLLLGTGGAGGRLWADDVPAAARKDYDSARALYLKGDAKSLTAAFSALSQGKAKAGDSVDFWELFVRVWRANKKPEADLWQKLIAPREQAAPTSAAFDLVRFRVETDAAKKREHLEKAVAKDPKAVSPRLLLARELRAQGEEDKAEELVDKLIEEQPGLEEALVTKVDLMLASGLSRVALKFAEEQLAKQECPGLRHALAEAQRNLVAEDKDMRAKALANAEKAVAARPDPAYVATLADLLDESERLPDALTLLKKHVASTPDERLTKRLGDYAWRAGDYDEAVKHLAAAAAADAKAAKALAFAHARRNRAKEALAAVDALLVLDKDAWDTAIEVAFELLDAAALRKHLAGRTFENAELLKAAADALEGKAAEAKAALAAKAADGSRDGEDALLVLLEARLHAKLGAKLAPLLKQWREVRAQVVGAHVPAAKADAKPLELAGRSHGFMQRMASYLRSVCGDEMTPGDLGMSVQASADGTPDFGWAIEATSDCARQTRRILRFKIPTEGNQIQLNPHTEVWDAALAAFKDGCAALVAEEYAKAQEAFGKALEQEKGWHRARFFKALAAALATGGDLAASAKEAGEAAIALPDDWFARELAVKLTVLAGGDPLPALKELHAHQDARSHGPLSEL